MTQDADCACAPDIEAFTQRYDAGEPQLVYRRIINDLDTPVSAYLKIAQHKPYAFLYESVQGGEQRGRYSFLGFAPDLVWRSHGDQSEIARGDAAIKADKFTPIDGAPLDALRELERESALSLPPNIPPMAAGLFGYMGYDMVRQVEHLPHINPDPIDTPDSIMIRPTIVAIFDLIAQEVILSTPVRPDGRSAAAAYKAAQQRIDSVAKDMTLGLSAATA